MDEAESAKSFENLSPSTSTFYGHPSKRKKLTPTCEVVIKDHKHETTIPDDYFDLVARTWASKLRRLPENIQPIAEKAVNDALFDVQMGKFTLDKKRCPYSSTYVNRHQHLCQSMACCCFSTVSSQKKKPPPKLICFNGSQNGADSTSNQQLLHHTICPRPFSR